MDYQDGDLVKLEGKDKDRRKVGLKGRVAVDWMLRCLSENREDAQRSASGGPPRPAARLTPP